MKRFFLLLLLTACGVTDSEFITEPLNGKWNSVRIDSTSAFMFVEFQILEELLYKNGEVYGGIIQGSGGYQFAHWWVEFRITSGVTDRINNTFRITFETENVYVDGTLVNSTGKIEGRILNDNMLSGMIQLNEPGRAYELIFQKVN